MATKSQVLSLIEDGDARTKARAILDELIEDAKEASSTAFAKQRIEIDRLTAESETARSALATAQAETKAKIDDLTAKLTAAPAAGAEVEGLRAKLVNAEKALAKLTPFLEARQTGNLHSAIAEAAGLKHPDMVAPTLAGKLGIALGPDGKLTPEHLTALRAWAADPVNADHVKPAEQAAPQAAPVQTPVPVPLPSTGPALVPGAKLTPAVKSYLTRLQGREQAAALKEYGLTPETLANA